MLRSRRFRWFVPLGIALLATACHRKRTEAASPVSLAEGSSAQAEFRLLRGLFFDADGPARAALTPRLGEFLQRYPDDPRTLDVRVYLAFSRIDAGDKLGARAFLEPALGGASSPALTTKRSKPCSPGSSKRRSIGKIARARPRRSCSVSRRRRRSYARFPRSNTSKRAAHAPISARPAPG
jgi:hypothetical protein